MYGFFAREIRSHRDLPFRLNQWTNVVRWEFKNPMPFLRTREFHWQEGHTAHLTKEEASAEVLQILDHYADIYEQLLAVPVVKGFKTKNEQFPGAEYTATIEGFIPASGRGIQAATSHNLGQHFSKMFDIKVEDPSAKEVGSERNPPIHVWQTSWGCTTRSIGIMVLTHGNDKGLVIPPRVAKIQVIIVPVGVTAKVTDEEKGAIYEEIKAMVQSLGRGGIRIQADFREGYSPGWKFSDWELKGVPLRLEYGPRDKAKTSVTACRRDLHRNRVSIPIEDLKAEVPKLLEATQSNLYTVAKETYCSRMKRITQWEDFVPTLDERNVCIIPHCLGEKCENAIKEMSVRKETASVITDVRAPSMGAKSLCIPFDQYEGIVLGETRCTNPKCEENAQKWVMFGRSY